ncbi:MAG: hypothetical protein K2P13_07190 [Lachnospiraceae bacterium]|nr:hypothetical protein [Lachnospiraceae bacterium]
MKKNTTRFLCSLSVFGLTAVILFFPEKSLYFALNGLNLWFRNMIPTLFPFMVLSGIMIRMNLTGSFIRLLKPFLFPVFRVNDECLYAILVGFLCGFPMGANVSAQLCLRNKITRREAEFLLAFCNNIGPVYFISFVIPMIRASGLLPLLAGMYGLPLLYGIMLRHTVFRDLTPYRKPAGAAAPSASFLQSLDESVMASLHGITKLGGYMIFFNLLNILPALFIRNRLAGGVISGLLEITGGIKLLKDSAPYVSLSLLPFGGMSCMAQTYSMIRDAELSLKKYMLHKLALTAVSAAYYFLLASGSF